jgi:hypothetical protein
MIGYPAQLPAGRKVEPRVSASPAQQGAGQ